MVDMHVAAQDWVWVACEEVGQLGDLDGAGEGGEAGGQGEVGDCRVLFYAVV